MPTFGHRSRFCFVVGKDDPDRCSRKVDIYAAGRWLTCRDNSVHVPTFEDRLVRAVTRLLDNDNGDRFRRPYPELSPAENYVRLRAGATREAQVFDSGYRFMDWCETTDNFRAHLYIDSGVASIPFSFQPTGHHDASELGQVFVAELPERELIRVIHQAACELIGVGL